MSTRIVYNSFDRMKAKIQNVIRTEQNFAYLSIADEAMFEYGGGFPFDRHFFESYLTTTGSLGMKQIGSEYYICPEPSRVGDLDQYGDGTEMEGVTVNGDQMLTGRIGEDCIIVYNNSMRTPDFDNFTDSSDIAQIEKATGINVKFSRIAPLFVAPNDTVKKAVEAIVQRLLDGELVSVASDSTVQALAVLAKNPGAALEAIDITKPERIQYVQYLSELYDQIIRRHFGRRGLAAKTSSKHAQVSQDEVHGLDCISWYYPLDKLKARKDALDRWNKIAGTSWTVDFSDIWRQEYEAYLLRIMQQDINAEKTAAATAADVNGGADDEQKPESGSADADPE